MLSIRIPAAVCLSTLLILSSPAISSLAHEDDNAHLDLVRGKQLFEDHCSVCHGMNGGGGRGPSLHTNRLSHAPDDKSLLNIIDNGIPPDMPGAWYLSEEEMANVAGYVRSLGSVPAEKLPGNARSGAEIYEKSGCASCHILRGHGNGYGPDLTEVGARRGGAALRDTLRHPESAMPADFLLVEVTTAAGQSIRGIRLNEDVFSIQLKDVSGRFYSFRKSELTDLKKLRGKTPMPSYDFMFSTSEREDLVAFLAAQRGDE